MVLERHITFHLEHFRSIFRGKLELLYTFREVVFLFFSGELLITNSTQQKTMDIPPVETVSTSCHVNFQALRVLAVAVRPMKELLVGPREFSGFLFDI